MLCNPHLGTVVAPTWILAYRVLFLRVLDLSWDALLKKTAVDLELLTDYDMHLFIKKGMRGGVCLASK